MAAGPGTAFAVGTVGFFPLGGSGATSYSFIFSAGPGDANSTTIDANAATVTITDPAGVDTSSTSSTGCRDNGNSVTCTAPAGATIIRGSASLGDSNDTGVLNGALGVSLDGDAGTDTLTGSDTNTNEETISGGDGNDAINTRNVGASPTGFSVGDRASGDVGGDGYGGNAPGNDTITTGNGNDSASGDGGTDTISTGSGDDSATGDEGDGDRVDLGEGNDRSSIGGASDGVNDVVQAGPGIDELSVFGSTSGPVETTTFDAFTTDLNAGTVAKTNNTPERNTATGFEDYSASDPFGYPGEDGLRESDTVIGTPGSNIIDTGGGNDTVNPSGDLGGADTLTLGAGNDGANTVDGFSDRVVCGSGTDTVTVDQFDEVADCEVVNRQTARPAGVGPPDTAAPKCKVTKVKKRYTRKAFLKGVTARASCNETSRVTMQLLVGVKGGKIVTSKVGDLVLAERTATIGVAAKSIKLKASRGLARRLPKGFRARVKIEARDSSGNRSVITKKVTVTAPKKPRPRRRPRR